MYARVYIDVGEWCVCGEFRRDCILKMLVIYLNEDPNTFFKEYLTTEDAERDIQEKVMGIYIVQRDGDGEPEDVRVVIEGIKVLNNMGSPIMGFIILFGLIYALDLSFLDNLKSTFKICHKIIMDLDGHKLNAKIKQLKIKLFA